MKKFYCSLTVANRNWTEGERAFFEATFAQGVGAEIHNDFGNLYTFEMHFPNRNEAFLFVSRQIADAFHTAGLVEAAYYLTISPVRGYLTHMTI